MPRNNPADRSIDPDLQPGLERGQSYKRKRSRGPIISGSAGRIRCRWCITAPAIFKWISLIMIGIAVCAIWPYIGWHDSWFDWTIGYIVMFSIGCFLFFMTCITLVIWFAGQHSDAWADSNYKWVELGFNVVMGVICLGCTIAGVINMTKQWYWLCKFPSEHDYCALRIRFAITTCAYCVATFAYLITALLVHFYGIEYYDDDE